MKSQNNTVAALYCRLSQEDKKNGPVSMSIENQQQLLLEYALKEGWKVYDTYIDDGCSGTTFDRPDFERMMRDAKAGKFNCIITKDTSRFGRNYIEVGRYTEEILPRLGIRFLTVHGGVDTSMDNDANPIFFMMDEIYAKQVSRKVRQVKASSARQGKFMGSQAPYGYRKSLEDKHKLVVDEGAAPIVRRLFHEFAGGDSGRMIAGRLNGEGVDSPQVYHDGQTGRAAATSKRKPVWGSATVIQLLRNQVYIGDMVQGMREVVSFKTKERRQRDQGDWYIVNGTHEPIVDRDLWDRVHARLGRRGNARQTKREDVGLFSGMVFCADCKSPLAYTRKKLKDSEKGVYRCSRYNNNNVSAQ